MSNFNSLPINADRICEAISKIGYNPSSAIMDIVDNSFVANAKEITIKLFIKEGMNINNRQNICKIQIIDFGDGMDENGMKKALELGSNVQYTPNSLSKYGLGLKSAGFSLGRRIELISKIKGGTISDKYFLDRNLIRDNNSFGYSTEECNPVHKQLIDGSESGTVVTFTDLTYTSKVSAAKIIDDLSYKAGVNYCEYLKKDKIIFKIQIIQGVEDNVIKEKTINPKDILFWEEANNNFVKESYDCKKPCKVLDTEFENPLNLLGEKIKIKATIFPKDSMRSYSLFTPSEQEKIKEYEVGLKNSGFYFYRNGRLIKWGMPLFLGREFGIRIKISFSTEHDELFDVDVSKQHLTVSEEVETILKTLTQLPRSQSRELFEICETLLKASKDNGNEGTVFNQLNATLEEEDDESSDINPTEASDRKEKLQLITSEKLGEENSHKYENEEEQDIFRRVRYWDKGRNLWDTGIDRVEGSYVLINKLHPFYDLVFNNLDKNSPERQSLEALFHAIAVGQNSTIQKANEAELKIIVMIFEKFCRYTSHQIENWVYNNRNLFENEN